MYTGNTQVGQFGRLEVAVYPCVYREHGLSLVIGLPFNGLSLCIQGTLLLINLLASQARFIPVYTGNTKFRVI